MKLYLKSIVKQLKNFSATLDKTAILIDKPWAMIDEDQQMQKLIFKKNHELILSRNGKVHIGKWEYLREARSLIIDRGEDTIMCNEAFIDKGVMILKLDGTDNQFFILANENLIPDLDAHRYIKGLRYQNLKIIERKLSDGRILEVSRQSDAFENPRIGDVATIEAMEVEDGKYKLANNMVYKIKKSVIYKVLTETTYTNPDGAQIIVERQVPDYTSPGDAIYFYGQKAQDGAINYSKSKNMIVKDGKFVKFESKSPFFKSISQKLGSLFES